MKAEPLPGPPARRPRSTHELVRQSLLYLELKAEHEEILKHKWLESEKLGRDVGLAFAKIDWRLKHASNWRRWWRQQQILGANI